MQVDRVLMHDAQTKSGGGSIHAAVQWTAAYEMAVARYNHVRTAPAEKPAIKREIESLEAKLRTMAGGMRRRAA